MRLTVPFVIGGLLVTAPGGPQDPERRIVVRDAVRDVVRDAHADAAREALREIARARMAYQGRDRGPEQTERFSRKVKIGRDGRVSVQNISGDIVVSAGSGDEVSIEAVKRGRREPAQLAATRIVVEERAGRVDVRTEYDNSRFYRNNNVSVDYTVTVPSGTSVDLKSVSGSVKVTGVKGTVRAESISGNVVTTDTPKVEAAKTVS